MARNDRIFGLGPMCLLALLGIWSLTPRAIEARTVAPGQAATELDRLLSAAGAYVQLFVDRFSNVVSEEQYTQDVLAGGSLLGTPRGASTATTHRVLRSDFLIVKTPEVLGWASYRDVFEVDGKPVRDRDERLTSLFANPAPDAIDQAVRIAKESARYNIGPTERTLNTPVLALLFLQTSLQPRFQFAVAPRTTDVSARTIVISYRETARPTIVRTVQDTDRPASGRFWIDAGGGQVLQSEMVLTGSGLTATFTTVFQPDARLGVAVPARLREEYQQPRSRLIGVATYTGFRQFAVNTRTTIDAEPPSR